MADETSGITPADTGMDPGEQRDLLQQILNQQQAHREEVAQLRAELESQRTAPRPAQSATRLTPEELYAQRMEEVSQHDFYCPGCGRLYHYQRECNGRPEAPHAPIDVVSTEELRSEDPTNHTAAPNTDVPAPV